MQILSHFDRNPKSIGLSHNYTTLIGSLIGLLAAISLLIIGITKLISVINY
jgi:uncharacterized membrane protein